MYKKTILLGAALSLVSTFALATDFKNEDDKKAIKQFVGKAIEATPLKVKSLDVIEVNDLKDSWSEYLVKISLENDKSGQKVASTSMFFTNGKFVSSRLYDVATDELLDKTMAPIPGKETKTSARLVAGDAKAEHSLIIYTDPLCPFCKKVVPEIVKEVNAVKDPNIGVYIVNLALPMHPESKTLLKVIAAESLTGNHNRALTLYDIKLKKGAPEKEILEASNSLLGTKYSIEDINTDKVKALIDSDIDNSTRFMIAATPTLFLDGERIQGLQKLGEILSKSK